MARKIRVELDSQERLLAEKIVEMFSPTSRRLIGDIVRTTNVDLWKTDLEKLLLVCSLYKEQVLPCEPSFYKANLFKGLVEECEWALLAYKKKYENKTD